jgi:CBS-domain-containing membrane protein
MNRTFPALSARPLASHATFWEPSFAAAPVTLDDPAVSVMTDLKQVSAVAIDAEATIASAMRVMVRRNVRLLFVVNIDNEIDGLVTATDLLGEKPLLYLREHGGRRADIRVRELMTPHAQVEVLAFAEVSSARVGHVVASLEQSGRQHALVADYDAEGRPMVRGIFSASQLTRQLGYPLQNAKAGYTFADIESALNH